MVAEARAEPIDTPAAPKPARVPAEGTAANEPLDGRPDNLIRRTVGEICALTTELHDLREDLRARGVDFHPMNAMIECSLKDKPEERARLAAEAVERAQRALGSEAVTREVLDEQLDKIVALEKDNRHVRILAAQQGVHMQALNFLTQLIGLNPGDGGVHAINNFIAYAEAAGVPFDQVGSLRAQFADEPSSVLPDIPRDRAPTRAEALREFLVNLAIGVALTVVVMSAVL